MEKRKYGGFESKIFLETVNMDFICPICSMVVRCPQECTVCGTLFCLSCINKWSERKAEGNIKTQISHHNIHIYLLIPFLSFFRKCKRMSYEM